MKNLKSLSIGVFLSILSTTSIAQTPTMDWVNVHAGTSNVTASDCQLDNSGNIYSVGYFEGTVDFDPGPGTLNLTSNGNVDFYIQKQDTLGNFLWAKSIGGPSADYALGMDIDPNGNLYITGYYWTTTDFDPGVGVANLTSVGSDDAFILKLDSNGDFIWVKSFGGTSQERGYDVEVDASGNVYSTGSFFSWTVDFDPGPGVYNLGINGSFCTYVSKLDSNGDFVWAKKINAGSNYVYPDCIVLDATENPIVGGRFYGNCDFDPGPLGNYINASTQDGFIIRLDVLGDFSWVHRITGSGLDAVTGLSMDPSGNHLISGYFGNTVDFDFGAPVSSSTTIGDRDAFIVKTDASMQYLWHVTFGSTSFDLATDVQTDNNGNVYSTGYALNSWDADPGATIVGMTSGGFVHKLDNNGAYEWAHIIGDNAKALDVDGNEFVYSTGIFAGTKNFDPNGGGHMETSLGGNDAYVHKIIPMCVATSITPDVASLTAQNVNCSYPDPVIYPTATNNCGDQVTGTPNVTFPITTSGLTTITWSYDDGQGNTTSQTQEITLTDNNPIAVCQDAVVMLDAFGNGTLLLNQVENGSNDDCGIASIVLSQTAFNCADQGSANTVILTVTDNNGNTGTCPATITVVDDIDPTASSPVTINVECFGDIPAPDVLVINDEADNCAGPYTVTFAFDVSDGLTCPETITRTYAVADVYGNTIFVTQTIVVSDNTNPTASNPTGIAVECVGDVPPANILVVTDEADNCSMPVVAFVGDVSDGLSCPETITRSYSVTDNCGNSIILTQIITVQDLTAPVLATAPTTTNVNCIGDIPPMTNLNWTDNCDGVGSISGSDVSDGLSCPETITRTWTIGDACGNSASKTQTITVFDMIAPVFATAPATINVDCIGDLPPMTNLSWTDNCDGAGSISGSDVSDGLSCPETITRTWTISDACGNSTSTTQTITVFDMISPVFATPPVNVSVDCIGDVPTMADLSWTDNCDGNGTVTGSDVSDGLSCPETITRTWSYVDNCGNTATTTQTITVYDVTPPSASNPVVINVECVGDVPAPDVLLINDEADNCTATPTVAFVSDVSDGLTCPETVIRSYSVTDNCGNSIILTQSIVIQDITSPVLTAPADISVECSSDVPVMADANWTDNCDGNGTVTGSDVSDGLSCPETITRTWTYSDICGNTATTTQTITVDDVTPPTASTPAPLNHDCLSCVPNPDINVITDAADNCTANPIVAFVSEVSDGQVNPETITRTYSITDDCGNVTNIMQTITITDSEAPVPDLALLTELLGECHIAEPFPPTATDNCVGTVLGTPNVIFPITAIGLTVITWSFDDGGGNITTQTQDAWNTPILFITTITNSGNVLTSDETNADYQWIDCDNGNAPIVGQISPSFVPSINGNYAVQLSRNGCVEITPCVTVNTIGLHELSSELVTIYPNPARTVVHISSPFKIVTIQLINNFGAIVKESMINEISVDGLPVGMYFVSIETEKGIVRSKLIIE